MDADRFVTGDDFARLPGHKTPNRLKYNLIMCITVYVETWCQCHGYGVLRQCLNLYPSASEEEDVIGRWSKLFRFVSPIWKTPGLLCHRYIATKKSSQGLAKYRENG